MDIQEYFHEDLVIFLDVKTQDELFESMYHMLYEKNIVKQTYLQAIQEREKIYPTGLQTETLGVAIPHTDSIHIKKEAIGIAVLENPIKFNQMGAINVDVEVNVVFALAIQKPDNQLGILQVIIELIQNKDILLKIKNSQTRRKVITLIEEFCLQKQ